MQTYTHTHTHTVCLDLVALSIIHPSHGFFFSSFPEFTTCHLVFRWLCVAVRRLGKRLPAYFSRLAKHLTTQVSTEKPPFHSAAWLWRLQLCYRRFHLSFFLKRGGLLSGERKGGEERGGCVRDKGRKGKVTLRLVAYVCGQGRTFHLCVCVCVRNKASAITK